MSIAEKLTTIAENEPKVYWAGYIDGDAEGYQYGYQDGSEQGLQIGYTAGKEDGYAAGQQAEYDRFWDAFQQNGNRTSYGYAFCGASWTKETFNPKYKITPKGTGRVCMGLFKYFAWQCATDELPTLTFDMLDLSGLTTSNDVSEMFFNCSFDRLEVDLTVSPVFDNMNSTFNGADGGVIKHMCVKMKPQSMKNAFHYLARLQTLTFVDGSEIGCNGLNLSISTQLDYYSLFGVLDVLTDKTTDTSGTSWVVTLGATNLAKLTDEAKAIATQKGWTLV